LIRFAAARGLPYRHVPYPTFARQPEQTLADVHRFLGLSADAAPATTTPHYIKGNPGVRASGEAALDQGPPRIVPDERWQSLPSAVLDVLYCSRRVRSVSRQLGYAFPAARRRPRPARGFLVSAQCVAQRALVGVEGR
jgi:hypothetical protein